MEGSLRETTSIYWWTAEIVDLWKECHKLNRSTQRLYAREVTRAMKVEYRSARRRLRNEINKKEACGWENLVNEVNRDAEALHTQYQMNRIAWSPDISKKLMETAKKIDARFPPRKSSKWQFSL